MNGDIAAAAAWTPADRQYMAENQALNTFAGELAALRRRLPVTVVLPDGELLSRAMIHARSRVRLREMHKRIARVTVQLHSAGVR